MSDELIGCGSHSCAVSTPVGVGNNTSCRCMVSDYRGQSLVRSLQARIAELESGLKAHELGLVRDETIRLQDDRIKRLDAALAKCHKAALPDPYDERDIDIHWLTKTILEITRKARQGNE